jgi:hypothetical protein
MLPATGASISRSSVSDSFTRYELGFSLKWGLDRWGHSLAFDFISLAWRKGCFRRVEIGKAKQFAAPF